MAWNISIYGKEYKSEYLYKVLFGFGESWRGKEDEGGQGEEGWARQSWLSAMLWLLCALPSATQPCEQCCRKKQAFCLKTCFLLSLSRRLASQQTALMQTRWCQTSSSLTWASFLNQMNPLCCCRGKCAISRETGCKSKKQFLFMPPYHAREALAWGFPLLPFPSCRNTNAYT